MRFKELTIFFLLVFCALGLNAQHDFDRFREFENRVKYFYPDSLLHFSNQVDTTSEIGLTIKFWSLGRMHYWKSDYPTAFKLLEKTSKYLETKDEPILLGELYLDLAASLSVVNQTGKALSYLLDAKSIFFIHGDKNQQASVAISLGELYRKIESYDKAFEILHAHKSLAKLNDYNYSRCLNRIAAVHSESGTSDSSLYYSYRALEVAERINEPHLIATAENEIGYVLSINRKFEESLPHFKRADSLWQELGMYRYAVNPMNHISVVYGVLGQPKKSIEISKKAKELIKDKGWHQIEEKIYEDLRNIYLNLNKPDSAHYYDILRLNAIIYRMRKEYEINTRMVESLFSQKENEQIIKKQKVLLENERLEKESIRQGRTNLLLFIALISIFLLSIFLYAFNQRKLKIKLKKKNKLLVDAVAANEALVNEISHRVKNNLAMLSGLLNIQSEKSNNQEVKNEIRETIMRVDSIATIHKKLYDQPDDAIVNLNEAIDELSHNIILAMGKKPEKHIKLNLERCNIEISKALTLCLILNEVITNSCKYGEIDDEKPLLISLTENDSITVKVSEYGGGFDINEIDQENGSMGVYLIDLLAKQLKADYEWKKEKGLFTFIIKFKRSGKKI